jgi:hypothetical protein
LKKKALEIIFVLSFRKKRETFILAFTALIGKELFRSKFSLYLKRSLVFVAKQKWQVKKECAVSKLENMRNY